MNKEELFAPIRERYGELKKALQGTDIEKIRKLTLEGRRSQLMWRCLDVKHQLKFIFLILRKCGINSVKNSK